MKCPDNHDEARLFRGNVEVTHRGVKLSVYIEKWECDTCGLDWATVEQMGRFQRAIKAAYAKKERERFDRREAF